MACKYEPSSRNSGLLWGTAAYCLGLLSSPGIGPIGARGHLEVIWSLGLGILLEGPSARGPRPGFIQTTQAYNLYIGTISAMSLDL